VRRRDLVLMITSVAAGWPLSASAEQPELPVIGYLSAQSKEATARNLAPFFQGLGQAGFVEDGNIAIEYRLALGEYDRLPALAAELAARNVAGIVSASLDAAFAAKAATSAIPIVFIVGVDPVALGLVASLSHPGGNLTGVSILFGELWPKRLELLHELLPKADLIGVLINPTNSNADVNMKSLKEAARSLGLRLEMLPVSNEGDIDAAFATIEQSHWKVLLVGDDPFLRRSDTPVDSIGGALARSCNLSKPLFHRRWRLDQLWPEPELSSSRSRRICRPHSQGCQARRPTGPAAEQIRAGRQSQDRASARAHCSTLDPRPRRRGHRVRRRNFIVGGVTALAVAPAGALAQLPSKQIPQVGILTPADNDRTPIFEAFRAGLRDHGYVEGRNIVLEFRLARGDYAALKRLAEELTKFPVDIIVTDGPASAQAAADVTHTIPIVMGVIGDPVVLGIVHSLARPGGNITGFTAMSYELSTKRVDLMRAAFPQLSAIVVLVNPLNLIEPIFRTTAEAARGLGLAVTRVEAASPEALSTLRPEVLAPSDGAVVVLNDAMFWNHRREIIALISAARVPAIYPEREYADDGGLMAYGANVPDNFRRAADYVDRILKGAKSGDLPIQEPVRFDFVVNLRTAQSLGLTIPPSILARADEVIE
jgi:putative ABC transport system substrate-binding protein